MKVVFSRGIVLLACRLLQDIGSELLLDAVLFLVNPDRLEAYPTCLTLSIHGDDAAFNARSLHFADDKKSEFPRIGIYAEESFRAECPRFALEGTSETRCFAIGFSKSTKQRQPSNARSAKRAVPY